LTIKAVISDLLNKTDFANATRVILSGEMEGGLAAFELADFFSETIHWADVKAVPIGGFYFPQNLARFPPDRRPKRYDNMPPAINSHVHDVFQSYTNIHCRNKNQNRPHLCGPANVGYLYPYIQKLFTLTHADSFIHRSKSIRHSYASFIYGLSILPQEILCAFYLSLRTKDA
jgi:hypothetical protein